MTAAVDKPFLGLLAWRLQAWLLAQWFNPRRGLTATVLHPVAWLYGVLSRRALARRRRQAAQREQPSCPVLVVGNLIVGGAGKTPATIAIVKALQGAGLRPGVVSRGHGRGGQALAEVTPGSSADEVGDEPAVIQRRTGVPLVVGRDRVAAALRLLELHPQVDLIVADDGLQHLQLQRELEVIVFDERGVGNGQLLPAGPLREAFTAHPGASALVLYSSGRPSTPWPGACGHRQLSTVCSWIDWHHGKLERAQPLSSLHGRTLLAVAGIAVPERFFGMLESAGLTIERLPLPDHHVYDSAPWPAGATELITTEKDAVKLGHWATGGLRIWVVGLDLALPAEFVAALLARLPPPSGRQRPLPPTDSTKVCP